MFHHYYILLYMDYSNTDPAWIDIHHPLISIEFDPNEQ